MIFVDRTAIDLPAQLNQQLKLAAKKAENFYLRKDRKQERFEFDNQLLLKTQEYVSRLFEDTCAYCEIDLDPKSQIIEQFRPPAEACSLDGVADPDWYWWLAYEWENIYLVCKNCSLHKKNLFPVQSKRAAKGTRGEKLLTENYLLLDPCVDDPAEYLHFLEDGTVQSLSRALSPSKNVQHDRGAITIEILTLNRAELISKRLKIINETQLKLSLNRKNATNTSFIRELRLLVDEFSNFVALKRQMVARFLVSNNDVHQQLRKINPDDIKQIEEVIATELKAARNLSNVTNKSTETSQQKHFQPTKSVNIKYDNVYIQTVEIKNFRAIKHIKINFQTVMDQSDENAQVPNTGNLMGIKSNSSEPFKKIGWKMILGENGVGKSSILKAITLALMGENFYERNAGEYRCEPKRIFNNKTREKNGFIKLKLSKGDPIIVEFTKSSLKFMSGGAAAEGAFVRAYGSARLFSHNFNASNKKSESIKELHNVGNLFHPEMLLSNPTNWLLGLNVKEFNSAALSISDLLNLSDNPFDEDSDEPNDFQPSNIENKTKKILSKKRGEVYLDSGYGLLPLAEQSDGYKSVLALMVDILAGLPESMHDKREATGIILIDEIESHLHPRWKMKIVKSLRNTFPGIQFIVTTHDPLCLKSLGKGEITVIKKDSENIYVYDEVSSPAGLRVDQLLTSELFGLDSTIDPDIDEKFYNYYRLLAKSLNADSNKISAEEKVILQHLKDELQQYNRLGFTRRDRLVYEFIDEYIAKSKNSF